ncbi:hypothetical protein BS47DRAFT_1367661 [Hydnum rufescens UP504]|uniref:Uncharacterized protein n=1 Tax=Hydnum rufescens UP504 TaxID=1448309 RepID=A0A9P6AIM5_9AGAM|nr:hypothetical protein BS47DRAFT_1367661 [Hydnum rufescens UP504]
MGIRQKDSQKVLEINFLFTCPDQWDAVLWSLRASNPEADACAVDTNPPNWRSDYQHFLDEGYIRQLFSDPWPVKEVEALLELAPPSNCPINTREVAKTVAVDMERACQALLQQMFEVQKSLEQFWCTSQFLHELTQAPHPENFSEGDHLCLKQLSLFLLLLAEFSRAAFQILLYASQHGPYIRLSRHIVHCIQKASILEPRGSFNQGAQDESVGAECIQFLIVLDPNHEYPEYALSNPALEADAKQCKWEMKGGIQP